MVIQRTNLLPRLGVAANRIVIPRHAKENDGGASEWFSDNPPWRKARKAPAVESHSIPQPLTGGAEAGLGDINSPAIVTAVYNFQRPRSLDFFQQVGAVTLEPCQHGFLCVYLIVHGPVVRLAQPDAFGYRRLGHRPSITIKVSPVTRATIGLMASIGYPEALGAVPTQNGRSGRRGKRATPNESGKAAQT